MSELDGVWEVKRTDGLLPPMVGVHKRIQGTTGRTEVGPVGVEVVVVDGRELHYRRPLDGFVDVVTPAEGGWTGRALFRGREYGRFRLVPARRVMDIRAQLLKHLDEAIAMEENVKRMLDAGITLFDDPQIVDLLEHHRVQTEEHSKRLRRRLEAQGGSPSMVREAVGVLGALAKLPLDMLRPEKAGRFARDAYAAEHLEIASYQLLERTASRAGDEETAEIARQNRGEEEEMARRLDEHWDLLAEQSLREEGAASRA